LTIILRFRASIWQELLERGKVFDEGKRAQVLLDALTQGTQLNTSRNQVNVATESWDDVLKD